jgi:hypothetical protein
VGFLSWIRNLFGQSEGESDLGRYGDFPDPQAQAEADAAENQNIYERYGTGDAPWQQSGDGGDEPPEEPEPPDEEPDEPVEEPAE